MMTVIDSIVLTGGPCGGKSSALPRLKAELERCGMRVLTVDETATDLIKSGIAPGSFSDARLFQRLNVGYMLNKHNMYFKAASLLPDDKPTVIIFDRGINDCAAYAGRDELKKLLAENGAMPIASRDRYGAVFHLTTAADGAADHYKTTNNSARTESAEQAIALDRATLAAWIGHPHLRVIGNDSGFDLKIDRLIAHVKSYLGIPRPLEIERKFLVRMPDLERLDRCDLCQKVDITQYYLKMPDGSNCRIRKRGSGDDCVYIKTEKHRLTDTVRQEIECRISSEEYERLIQYADPGRRAVVKTRRLFVYAGKYYELDLFDFWKDRALLEIELLDESERFELPDFIDTVKEVTGDRRYNNSSLALQAVYEDID